MRRSEYNRQRNLRIKLLRQLLEEHDFFYDKSDDPRIYAKGLAKEKEIKALAESDGNLMKIYEAKKRKVYV